MKCVLFLESFVSGDKRSDSQLKELLRAYCLLFYIPPDTSGFSYGGPNNVRKIV